MIQTIPTPERPHFIFDGKMWEIENKYNHLSGDRFRTTVTFEHIHKTAMIDEDLGFNGSMGLPAGSALTITETVQISIDDEFDEPEITMYIKNTGSVVGKDRKNRIITDIEPLSLPLFVIQKLARESVKMDCKNRLFYTKPHSKEFSGFIEKLSKQNNTCK